MQYEEALKKLHELERKGISPGLERIEELARRLGDPQKQLARCIHIAGTNGKGSVAAMLDSMLRAAGHKTALFTSPHLYSHTERYRIAGQPIGEIRFAELFSRVYAQIVAMVSEGWASPTEFEAVTALAFLWFAEEKVDEAVIEVGLGGLTDSTNIIDAGLAIITNVGLDHTDFLGDTIKEIAVYKAGIIKPGAQVVTAAAGEALAVIEAQAARRNAPLYRLGQEFNYTVLEMTSEGSLFNVHTVRQDYNRLALPLLGRHQFDNAALAVLAGELLGLSQEAIRQGMAGVIWPIRLEIVSRQPLILLDGAHNFEGVASLRAALDALWPDKDIVCVLGMLADKEKEKSLDLLLPRIRLAVISRPPYLSRSGDWQIMEALCHKAGKPVIAIEDNRQAVRYALDSLGDDEMLLVCGSLYLAAEIRKYFMEEEHAFCK